VGGILQSGARIKEQAGRPAVAAVPAVRNALKSYQRGQREIAVANGFKGLVMEGRDIGSVIFPDADVKIFLEADEATRAKRRAGEGQSDVVAEREDGAERIADCGSAASGAVEDAHRGCLR